VQPGLKAEALAFTYPGEADRPLRGRTGPLSLRLDPGECLHIAGPTGCGKSTLARCLTGLIPHLYHGQMSGTVWIGDLRSDQAPLWQLSEIAGLVFQNPASQMLAPTVEEEIIFGLENLGLPKAEIDRRLENALERFGLVELRHRLPQTLSGGEQQKLALASIAARRPPVLVLDEPLSMLDTTAAFDFVAHLAEWVAQGGAAAICEHRREYLQTLPNLRTLILDGSPELATPLPGQELPLAAGRHSRIEAKGLSVSRGGRAVLQGLDLTLEGGQVTAIVGRNGAGKTTLLRALAGLQPYQGELAAWVDGRSETPQLGLVFQNPDLQLFNATVRQEILYRMPQVNQRLPEADLDLYRSLVAALDLERYQETPPLLLSEGEKRRVALATLLVRRPPHGVLLDEPALGQDAAHKALLMRLLHSVARQGQVVAFATHDIELAACADRLLLLDRDGFLADGPPEQVLADHSAWDRLGLRLPDWVLPCPS
jgi:energy-coupling factor transporter ATP-binding protein EcfA2